MNHFVAILGGTPAEVKERDILIDLVGPFVDQEDAWKWVIEYAEQVKRARPRIKILFNIVEPVDPGDAEIAVRWIAAEYGKS